MIYYFIIYLYDPRIRAIFKEINIISRREKVTLNYYFSHMFHIIFSKYIIVKDGLLEEKKTYMAPSLPFLKPNIEILRAM